VCCSLRCTGSRPSGWARLPDHVVFLGPRAHAYGSADEMAARQAVPELVFIGGDGVYAKASFGVAKLAQLRCYYDVLARHDGDAALATLTEAQVADLLDWDAEQYRMALAD